MCLSYSPCLCPDATLWLWSAFCLISALASNHCCGWSLPAAVQDPPTQWLWGCRRKHIPALNLSEMPVMASGNTKESSFSKNLQGVSVGISRQLCHEDTVDTVGKLSIFFLVWCFATMLVL